MKYWKDVIIGILISAALIGLLLVVRSCQETDTFKNEEIIQGCGRICSALHSSHTTLSYQCLIDCQNKYLILPAPTAAATASSSP